MIGRILLLGSMEANFTIYLEGITSYKKMLSECGFSLPQTEIVKTTGQYKTDVESIKVNREFILIVAEKLATS